MTLYDIIKQGLSLVYETPVTDADARRFSTTIMQTLIVDCYDAEQNSRADDDQLTGVPKITEGGSGTAPVLLDLYDSTSQNYYLPDGWNAEGWSYGSSSAPILFAPTSNPPQSIQSAFLSGNRVQIKFANLDSETPMIMECIGYCQGTSVNWYLYVMKEDGRMVTIRYE